MEVNHLPFLELHPAEVGEIRVPDLAGISLAEHIRIIEAHPPTKEGARHIRETLPLKGQGYEGLPIAETACPIRPSIREDLPSTATPPTLGGILGTVQNLPHRRKRIFVTENCTFG